MVYRTPFSRHSVWNVSTCRTTENHRTQCSITRAHRCTRRIRAEQRQWLGCNRRETGRRHSPFPCARFRSHRRLGRRTPAAERLWLKDARLGRPSCTATPAGVKTPQSLVPVSSISEPLRTSGVSAAFGPPMSVWTHPGWIALRGRELWDPSLGGTLWHARKGTTLRSLG